MDVKSIFLSKTLWLNLLGPVFLWLAGKGVEIDPPTQDAIIVIGMAGANIIMRRFTKTPVAVTAPISKTTASSITALLFMLSMTTLLLVGAACTSAQVTTSLDDLKTGCAALAVAEANSPLTGGAAKTASKTAAPFDAFCSVVSSGIVPGNADANSLAWVQTGASTISTIVALNKSP